jgi:hypothetical protein
VSDIVTRLRAVFHNDRSVELMNREAADEIVRLERVVLDLIAERDEARQLYCSLEAEDCAEDGEEMDVVALEIKEREIAESLGWDCFKEDGK